jgi:hypothetical protein
LKILVLQESNVRVKANVPSDDRQTFCPIAAIAAAEVFAGSANENPAPMPEVPVTRSTLLFAPLCLPMAATRLSTTRLPEPHLIRPASQREHMTARAEHAVEGSTSRSDLDVKEIVIFGPESSAAMKSMLGRC